MKPLSLIKNIAFASLGVFFAVLVGEGVVRLATLNQENYVIEMWRYAKELKEESPDSRIGHQHVPNRSAQLQNVPIAINEYGMRGPQPDFSATHRVAVVGDSVALGWGVSDEQNLRGQLAQKLPADFDVVNSGVGNMNVEQSVRMWQSLRPSVPADIIVVLVTPRATAQVVTEKPSWLVENSQLFALIMTFVNQLSSGEYGEDALVKGYQQQWRSPAGNAVLNNAFEILKGIAVQDNADIIVVSIPEMHDLNTYQFAFMGDITHEMARKYGFEYIDPLSFLKGPDTQSFWVSSRDIHLNGKAFDIISDLVVAKISEKADE